MLPLHHGIAGANLADFREGCKRRNTVCLRSPAANLSRPTSLREAVRRAAESAVRSAAAVAQVALHRGAQFAERAVVFGNEKYGS